MKRAPFRKRRHAAAAIGCAVSLLAAVFAPAQAGKAQEIAALKAKIAALSAQASLIDDANRIRNLQRAYGYYIGKGYWHEAADLFADNATMEIGVDGVYVGKAHILERLIRDGGGNPGPGLPFGQIYDHMILQPVVSVAADGRTAKGRWREIDILGHYQKDAAWGSGVYENEYVKQNGVWKIWKQHVYPNFVAPYEGGWAALKPVAGDWKSDVAKAFPADRPPTADYKPFPNVYTPPFDYKNPVTGQ